MECFRRGRWKPKCRAPDLKRGGADREVMDNERGEKKKKRMLYIVSRRTLKPPCPSGIQEDKRMTLTFYVLKTFGIRVNRGDLAVPARKCLAFRAAQLSGGD